MDNELIKKILAAQKNEITEYHVYTNLAGIVKKQEHADILKKIASEEKDHYEFFSKISQTHVKPDRVKVFVYLCMAKLLGLNFGLRFMENGEGMANSHYEQIKTHIPEIEDIAQKEKEHENKLLGLIDEDRLKYVSSMVLGLNDALVELTATLAGFTLALQNTKLIAVVGLITGIAAAMSMAASEYLATKGEAAEKNPIKACIYTGITYIGTVLLLVSPFFVLGNVFMCLGITVACAVMIIFFFTFYVSVAKGLDFKKRFFEMTTLSLSISAISFFIGMAMKKIFGIEI
ncbi:MAG TPA: VIT1/CCC1 family protein [Candidatus Omnitrophota bacterium]|nr:VIT1/CCC1 family protein [Candidatus Omnitrophota bacterium]